MTDVHLLSPRKARICRVAGGVFLLVALLTAIVIGLSAASPEMFAMCKEPYCEISVGPIDLLPKDVQAGVRGSVPAMEAFERYQRTPLVRAATMGILVVRMGPFAVLLLGVGLALRRLGGRGDALGGALPWLRRASMAAMLWVISASLSDSLHIMLLYPGTPAGAHWHFVLDLQGIATGVMLAIAAYATVWALEAGVKAQRDLAEIV